MDDAARQARFGRRLLVAAFAIAAAAQVAAFVVSIVERSGTLDVVRPLLNLVVFAGLAKALLAPPRDPRRQLMLVVVLVGLLLVSFAAIYSIANRHG